jgi:hypothetical protein
MSLQIDNDALNGLVRKLVAEAMGELNDLNRPIPDRLAFSESEAARLLGLNPHQLRNERRRGRIAASEIVGRRIRYKREDLVGYLMRNRVNEA